MQPESPASILHYLVPDPKPAWITGLIPSAAMQILYSLAWYKKGKTTTLSAGIASESHSTVISASMNIRLWNWTCIPTFWMIRYITYLNKHCELVTITKICNKQFVIACLVPRSVHTCIVVWTHAADVCDKYSTQMYSNNLLYGRPTTASCCLRERIKGCSSCFLPVLLLPLCLYEQSPEFIALLLLYLEMLREGMLRTLVSR